MILNRILAPLIVLIASGFPGAYAQTKTAPATTGGAVSSNALPAGSVADGVLVNADEMFRDLDKKLMKLDGNVQVIFQGQHMTCDHAVVDFKNEKITATGHVILTNERVYLEGEKIVFNYKNDTGTVYKGFVQSDQVVFEGDVIEKVGKDRYIATNAFYTACETCPAAWSFSGKKIDAEMGGYARIKRPVFRIVGVPVLLLPSIIVPLKSARQSGVLVPTMDYSDRGGLAIGATYFWAINKSQDLSITPKWYEFRGYKGLGEYRYVLSEQSRGELKGAWIHDRAFQQELQEKYDYPESFDRWFAQYDHIYELPGDYVHRANLKALSDLRYLRDFPDEVSGYGDPAVENKTSVSRSTDDQYVSAEVGLYTNLLKSYPLSSNDDAVHRFPEIRYSLKEKQIGEWGPLVSMNVNYVNFARAGHSYDDLVNNGTGGARVLQPISTANNGTLGPHGEVLRDGQYDPATDLMRVGQRLDIMPKIAYPFHLGRKFDLMPQLSFRETQYRFNPPESAERPATTDTPGFNSTAARRYAQADFGIKTEFSRVFGSLSDPKANRWKHSLEPELNYSQILWSRRPNHPFFGDQEGGQWNRQFEPLTDAELNSLNNKVQFDYNDRTYEKQVVDFAINNRLMRKLWFNGTPDYQTPVIFRLSQSYDFNEARSTTPHPWSAVNGLLNMRFTHFETYTTASYWPYARVSDLNTRVRFMLTPANFLQVNYTDSYALNEESKVTGRTSNYGVGAGINSKYLDAQGGVDFASDQATKDFKMSQWHYAAIIKPPGRCWTIMLDHRQVVGGDRQIHASLNFDFGGGPPPLPETASALPASSSSTTTIAPN